LLFYETRALTFVCFVKFSIKYTRKMKQIFFALKIMCVKARMKKNREEFLFCVTICFILHRNKRNVEEVEIIVRLRELFSSMNALASIKRNAKVCFLHFILNKQDPSIRHFHSACYCIHLRYYQAIGCYRYISKRAKKTLKYNNRKCNFVNDSYLSIIYVYAQIVYIKHHIRFVRLLMLSVEKNQ
jgi:hypothetical protein